VTGFLGSGKTTFINTILNDSMHKLKIAVIENEFGEARSFVARVGSCAYVTDMPHVLPDAGIVQIGIDDALLSVQTAENVVEMNNGCICCTVRGDLVRSARVACCPEACCWLTAGARRRASRSGC
jgi:G3E family GTPase